MWQHHGGACLGGVADLVAEAARGRHRTDRTKQCQRVQGKPRTSNWWRPTGAAPEHDGSRARTLATEGSGTEIGGGPGRSEQGGGVDQEAVVRLRPAAAGATGVDLNQRSAARAAPWAAETQGGEEVVGRV
jgi:hypothetical protein